MVEKARQQDAELQKRQAQLKSQLQRFQKFVYTNEEKTTLANRRASAERETSHSRDKEIAVLQRQLAVDEVMCKGLELQVQDRTPPKLFPLHHPFAGFLPKTMQKKAYISPRRETVKKRLRALSAWKQRKEAWWLSDKT